VKMLVNATGFKELDAALAQLPKAAAKRTLQRTLLKAAQPIADAASANAPRDTGELSEGISVGTRLGNNVGKAEYAEVMKSGGTKGQAVAAMRGARRDANGGTFAVAFVGPRKGKTKREAIKAIVQEFGSVKQPPQAYMRPAWDSEKMNAMAICRRELATEIITTAKRLAKSKRQSADVKYHASLAALMAHEAEA
jgi:HK97 gp10 family phage protein